MKTFIALFLSFLILLTGCSSTHQVVYCMAIKEKVEDENALIKLKSGEEIEGKIAEISVDSTFNKNMISRDNIIIPALEIKEIHINDHWNGALKGIGRGMLTGAILGVLGTVIGGGGQGASFAIVVLSIGGGIVGLPIGLIVGQENNYIFSSSVPNEYVRLKITEKTSFDNSKI